MAHIPQIAVLIAIAQESKEVAERPRHGGSGHHGGPERGGGIAQGGFVGGKFAEERRGCFTVFPKCNGVAVRFSILCHLDERVVGYGAGEGYIGLDAPVPFVWLEGRVIVEESGHGIRTD